MVDGGDLGSSRPKVALSTLEPMQEQVAALDLVVLWYIYIPIRAEGTGFAAS